jgi:rubrerythrin
LERISESSAAVALATVLSHPTSTPQQSGERRLRNGHRLDYLRGSARCFWQELIMGVQFDFSKLDAMDVMDLAGFFEREAAETYQQLASWAETDSPVAAEFFHRMAHLEGQHDSRIENRRQEFFGDRPSRYTDAAPWEVEMPDFDQVGSSFTLEQAYRLALGAEERAEAYFRQAIDYISDAKAVEILEQLADEELEHQQMLKNEMAARVRS